MKSFCSKSHIRLPTERESDDRDAVTRQARGSVGLPRALHLFEEAIMTATTTPATLPAIEQKGYAHPEMLVSTDWLAAHLNDASLRIVESDEDVLLYDMGHIPNAQKIDWHADLNDAVVRDYVSKEQFQELLRSKGIDENTTVIFYGDKNNWWATYALWVFQLFGFTNGRVL